MDYCNVENTCSYYYWYSGDVSVTRDLLAFCLHLIRTLRGQHTITPVYHNLRECGSLTDKVGLVTLSETVLRSFMRRDWRCPHNVWVALHGLGSDALLRRGPPRAR